ncbi:TIGR02117 family protein [soil metagenome]
MQKAIKYIRDFVGAIIVIIVLYIVISIIGSLIPVNIAQPVDREYIIFIESNGVHTDIIMPIANDIIDWTTFVSPGDTRAGNIDFAFVAFGWGDLGFYENTPEWKDLNPGIAFKTLFLDSPAAMHVKFRHYVVEDDRTISIKLSREQYEVLAVYIQDTFIPGPNGKPKHIKDLHYDKNDAFYHATGSLSLLKTCNTWTNNALKESGVRASLWTPFVEGIFYSHSRY